MKTNYDVLDSGRMKIMGLSRQVLELFAINYGGDDGTGETLGNINSSNVGILHQSFNILLVYVFFQFQKEEEIMKERKYNKLEEHAADHILIRQRLTYLSDLLELLFSRSADIGSRSNVRIRSADDLEAAISIIRKDFLRVFDKHFVDDDMEFANSIPPALKTFKS
jgi:hypothetical protein